MRGSGVGLLASVVLVLAPLSLVQPGRALTMAAFEAKVVGVADGDTLTVLHDQKQVGIELHGIDTPEMGQPYGTRAKQVTAELAFGQIVRVEPIDRDQHGRIVAEVILPGGRSLNRELVGAGLAWWHRRSAPHDPELATLEADARATRRGLWAGLQPVPPWDWRRGTVTEGGRPSQARPTSRGWLLRSPSVAALPGDDPAMHPVDEWPVIQAYPDAEACERARVERLSAALRVAKAMDADPEAEVTAEAWQRTLAVSAARCVPAP